MLTLLTTTMKQTSACKINAELQLHSFIFNSPLYRWRTIILVHQALIYLKSSYRTLFESTGPQNDESRININTFEAKTRSTSGLTNDCLSKIINVIRPDTMFAN